MIDTATYALMAGDAYISNRPEINQFPVPQDWVEFKHVTLDSGFEAVSFTDGNEIVISFAGTNTDDIHDILNDIALADGKASQQLFDAAKYYMEVKALYPNAKITFTGQYRVPVFSLARFFYFLGINKRKGSSLPLTFEGSKGVKSAVDLWKKTNGMICDIRIKEKLDKAVI